MNWKLCLPSMRKPTVPESPTTISHDTTLFNEHPSNAHKSGALRAPNVGAKVQTHISH